MPQIIAVPPQQVTPPPVTQPGVILQFKSITRTFADDGTETDTATFLPISFNEFGAPFPAGASQEVVITPTIAQIVADKDIVAAIQAASYTTGQVVTDAATATAVASGNQSNQQSL